MGTLGPSLDKLPSTHPFLPGLSGRHPKAFPGHPGDLVSPGWPGSALGPPPSWACPGRCPGGIPARYLSHLNWFLLMARYSCQSKFLVDDQTSHPTPQGEHSHPAKKTHFCPLNPQPYFFGHDHRWESGAAPSSPWRIALASASLPTLIFNFILFLSQLYGPDLTKLFKLYKLSATLLPCKVTLSVSTFKNILFNRRCKETDDETWKISLYVRWCLNSTKFSFNVLQCPLCIFIPSSCTAVGSCSMRLCICSDKAALWK